jgi:hypothetical protein
MLKSTYVDPSFNSVSRVEFKLLSSDECILNTIELCNFGFATAPGSGGVPALKVGGIYNLIKHAYLYSGNMEIDAVRDVCSVVGASLLWGDADNAVSVLNEQTQVSQTATVSNNSLELLEPANVAINGNVKLTDIFPFLNATKMLVNYPNLRVVFELNTTISQMFSAPNPTSYTLLVPFLKFESVSDEMAKKSMLADNNNYGVVIWNTVYSEVASVLANATSSLKLRGFSGKIVSDIVMQTQTTPSQALLGFGYSLRRTGEIMNMTVNNRKLLPLSGIDTDAKKMMTMEKYKQLGYFGTAMTPGTGFNNFTNDADNLFGNISFARFELLVRVSDLQFDYTNPSADILTLRFIGNVVKSLSRDTSGNVLSVSY